MNFDAKEILTYLPFWDEFRKPFVGHTPLAALTDTQLAGTRVQDMIQSN